MHPAPYAMSDKFTHYTQAIALDIRLHRARNVRQNRDFLALIDLHEGADLDRKINYINMYERRAVVPVLAYLFSVNGNPYKHFP